MRITGTVQTVDLSDTSIAGDMRSVYSKTADMVARRELLRALDNPNTMSQVARHDPATTGGGGTAHRTVAEVFAGMGMGLSERLNANAADIKAEVKSPVTAAKGKKGKGSAAAVDSSRMATAIAFNALVKKHSSAASLVVTNLPLMRSVDYASDFVGYVETMLEGVGAVLMIRGAGKEVVTTYG